MVPVTWGRKFLLAAATLYLGLACGLAGASLIVAASPLLGPYAPLQLPGDLAFGFPFMAAVLLGATASDWRMALAGTLAMTLTVGAAIAATFLTPALLGYTPERGAALNLAVQQAFGAVVATTFTAGPGLLVGLGLGHLWRGQDWAGPTDGP